MNARNLSIAVALLMASCAGRPQAREHASATPQPFSMAAVAAAVDIDWPRDGEAWQNRGRVSQLAHVGGQLLIGGRRNGPPGLGPQKMAPGLVGELQLRDGHTGAWMAEAVHQDVEEFDMLASATSGNFFFATGHGRDGLRAFVGEASAGPQPRLAIAQVELPADVTYARGDLCAMDAAQHWLLLALRTPVMIGEEIVPMRTVVITGLQTKVLTTFDFDRRDGWRLPNAVALSETGYLVAGSIGNAVGKSPKGWVLGVDRAGRQVFETVGCGMVGGDCRFLGIAAASRGGHVVAGHALDRPDDGYFFATIDAAGQWTHVAPLVAPAGAMLADCDIHDLAGGPGAAQVFGGTCADTSGGTERYDMVHFWRDGAGAVQWSPPRRSVPYVREVLWDRGSVTVLRDVEPESRETRKQRLLIWRVREGVDGAGGVGD